MCFFIGFHVNLPTTCIFTLFRNQQRVMFKLYDIKEQWAVRLRPRAFAKPRCSTPQKDNIFSARQPTLRANISKSTNMTNFKRHALDGRTCQWGFKKKPSSVPMEFASRKLVFFKNWNGENRNLKKPRGGFQDQMSRKAGIVEKPKHVHSLSLSSSSSSVWNTKNRWM